MRRILSLAALIIISFAAKAQIKGTIQERTELKGIAGAVITLTKQTDSTNTATTVTDTDGKYEFAVTPAGKYILRVEALNYQESVSIVSANDSAATTADVFVDVQGKDLASVTVVATAPPVVQKGDTSQFSASQYKVNPDATTEDLIKKMPGITVDKSGTVTAQGETVKKVTIDGKEFFGDDASAALKNLPSEVVDKIQVFDRLSDQAQLTGFDDGNSVKAINIVTKSGIKNGQFGRVYAGYGTDDRYSAGGNVSFFKGDRRLSFVGNFNNINQQNFASQDLLGLTSSGGRGGGGGQGGRGGGGGDFNVNQSAGISKTNALGINFSNVYNKKLTLSGSYFFNNSRNNNQSLTNTETFYKADTNLFTRQNSLSFTSNSNHRINLRLEYKIDSSNSLFIIPSINIQNNNSESASNYQSFRSEPGTGLLYDTTQTNVSNSDAERKGYNIRNNILFRHSFAKKGRSISLGFNMNFTKNDGETISLQNNRFFRDGILFKDSLQNIFYDNATNGHTLGGTIAYTEPVGKKAQLQIDYNPSVQINKADQKTFNFDGGKYTKLDTSRTNLFDNRITTNNGGLTYRYSPNKDEQFSIGASVQNARLESDRVFPSVTNVNQTFTSVLPNLMWRKKLSTASNIRVFYRASTNFPSVSQLQDVVNTTNPLRATTGNPFLKQSYTQFVAGRYTYTNTKTSKSFFANIFLQTASDYITNATFIPVNTPDSTVNGVKIPNGAQLTKPVNLDGYRSLRTFFTYSMLIKAIKTNVNLNAGVSFSRLPGLANNVTFITNNSVYNAGIVFASNISQYVDFNINYNATFNNSTGGITGGNNYINQSVGLQGNLLNKKGWFLQNDISYQANSGLSDGLNQKYGLWNAAVGKKFLKNNAGELKLSVFDLLHQNQSITRTVTTNYIEDVQSVVLQRYFMLTFTYNLKNFGTASASSRNRQQQGNEGGRPQGTPPGGPGF